MKKGMSLLVALVMLLSLLASTAVAETVAATWYLTGVEYQGVKLPPSSFGMEMTIVLAEDGTGSTFANEQEVACTWTQEGEQVTISVDNQAMVFVMEDGKLVSEMDGGKMIFSTSQEEEIQLYVPGAFKSGLTIEDFNGTWNCTLADMNGMQLPLDVLGMSMTLSLENGAGSLSMLQGDAASDGGKVNGVVEEMTQEDGTIVSALNLTPEGENGILQMLMTEDGKLSFAEPNTGMIFYLELLIEDAQ